MNHLNRMFRFLQVSAFFFAIPFCSVSQQDFSDYQTLLCKGEIPFDFKASISEKVAKDLETSKFSFNSKTEAQDFWTEIHTELREVFHSGHVIYGDDISKYVQQVAANLLKNDPELLKKLRFYTIKSNQVNAFSTAPGIIFVTTGLISQLASEAQLAFILSHEIAHFEKDHVYHEYLNLKKTGTRRKRDQILKLSQFSKELEFEADQLAIKRYHQLGYSSEELIGTFDILMYSYLPFDEIAFPSNYFNTEQLFIPKERIELEIKPITAREDYNDSFHTHPNIKKRKEAIQLSLDTYSNWGKTKFILDEKTFHQSVTSCRFEDVRINLVQGNVFSALYSIFLLKRIYPENTFLRRMEALSWLSVLQAENLVHKRFDNPKIEGESSKLHKFLKAAKKVELATIGLRIIYDLKAKYPDDPFISGTYHTYLEELSTKNYFDLSKFQTLNYHQAANAAIAKTKEQNTPVKDSVENTSGNKYSRIKEKRAVSAITDFDSTYYAIYALSDMIQDAAFTSEFKGFKAHQDSLKEADKDFSLLSSKDQERVRKEALKKQSAQTPSFKQILIFEPEIALFSSKSLPDWEVDRANKIFRTMIQTLCDKNGFTPVFLEMDSVAKSGTDAFNEYAVYSGYLEQILFTNNGKSAQSVDFQLIDKYAQASGIPHILSPRIYYLKDYQSLNMQSLFIDLNKSKVLSDEAKKTDILLSDHYTPFFHNFFIAMRKF